MRTVSLVIPVFNESLRIGKTLSYLEGFKPKDFILESIIFVDDGSTDSTLPILKKWIKTSPLKKKYKLKVVSYMSNVGRGSAVREGLKLVTSDYGLYLDGDMSIPLENLIKFSPYLEKGIDLIVGSKKMPSSVCLHHSGPLRRVISVGHSFLASFILGVFFWDFQGGFKVFSRKLISDVVVQTRIERWGFDMEIIYMAKKLGYEVVELPVTWSCVRDGSKVNAVRDILFAIRDMINIRTNSLKEEGSSNTFNTSQVPLVTIY